MLTLVILATSIYLIKMLVDYVQSKAGYVHISPIKGMMMGFDVSEEDVAYEVEGSDKPLQMRKFSVEIAIFFVSLLFIWQVDIKEEDDYVY